MYILPDTSRALIIIRTSVQQSPQTSTVYQVVGPNRWPLWGTSIHIYGSFHTTLYMCIVSHPHTGSQVNLARTTQNCCSQQTQKKPRCQQPKRDAVPRCISYEEEVRCSDVCTRWSSVCAGPPQASDAIVYDALTWLLLACRLDVLSGLLQHREQVSAVCSARPRFGGSFHAPTAAYIGVSLHTF